VPLVVLGLAIVMESLSLRTAVAEATKVRGELGWVAYIRQAKSPEIPVVLLEDVAALLGLFFALVGVGMTLITDNGYWDVIGTTAIGLLLVAVAVCLGIETKSLLLGEAATLENQGQIAAAIAQGGDGLPIIHLRTLQLGPSSVLVAAKIAAAPTDTAADLAAQIDAAEARIRAVVPDATYVFIEPDIRRPDPESTPA
jgi:divalent metal cation (Fe/Co/Zn/Cd) transporter